MRRSPLLTLFALFVLAALTSYLLKNTRSLGSDVGNSDAAFQVLNDRESPRFARGNSGLTLVMFTDYQCAACRRADPALQAALVRDGNVRVIYKDWPVFGARSERAAKVALAAHRQGIYASVHHKLMKSRVLDEVALRAAVEEAGGNWQRLQSDLLLHRSAIENQLATNSQHAFALGLRGTPSYLIGDLLIEGALTEREFLRAFNEARSDA